MLKRLNNNKYNKIVNINKNRKKFSLAILKLWGLFPIIEETKKNIDLLTTEYKIVKEIETLLE